MSVEENIGKDIELLDRHIFKHLEKKRKLRLREETLQCVYEKWRTKILAGKTTGNPEKDKAIRENTRVRSYMETVSPDDYLAHPHVTDAQDKINLIEEAHRKTQGSKTVFK